MSRRPLPLLLGAAALALAGCLPTSAPDAGGRTAATSSGGGAPGTPGAGMAVTPEELPQIVYPEERRLRAERVVTMTTSALAGRYREVLSSDGDGRFALELIQVSPAPDAPWAPPSNVQMLWHDLRQRYLVRYRDLHLGHPTALRENHHWLDMPGAFECAKRECRKYVAVSRHGHGEAEFLVDSQTGLLLGWTLRNAAGRELMSLRTVDLDLEPDLDGVAWPGAELVDDPYDPQAGRGQVGFTPVEPSYVPPGFYLKDQRILRTRVLEPALSDMHVAVYHDGVRPLFVAQHDRPGSGGGGPGGGQGQPLHTITRSEVHGVQVAEGRRNGRRLYVVGILPADEIELVAGSALL